MDPPAPGPSPARCAANAWPVARSTSTCRKRKSSSTPRAMPTASRRSRTTRATSSSRNTCCWPNEAVARLTRTQKLPSPLPRPRRSGRGAPRGTPAIPRHLQHQGRRPDEPRRGRPPARAAEEPPAGLPPPHATAALHAQGHATRATPDGPLRPQQEGLHTFTSPIRRYSDLVVHRVFGSYPEQTTGVPRRPHRRTGRASQPHRNQQHRGRARLGEGEADGVLRPRDAEKEKDRLQRDHHRRPQPRLLHRGHGKPTPLAWSPSPPCATTSTC